MPTQQAVFSSLNIFATFAVAFCLVSIPGKGVANVEDVVFQDLRPEKVFGRPQHFVLRDEAAGLLHPRSQSMASALGVNEIRLSSGPARSHRHGLKISRRNGNGK